MPMPHAAAGQESFARKDVNLEEGIQAQMFIKVLVSYLQVGTQGDGAHGVEENT